MTPSRSNLRASEPLPAKHTRSATRIVHTGGKFRLRTDTLSLPNGPELDKDIVEHPGSVVIIPIADDGRLVLIKQWRPAIERYSIELPSGTLEAGESSAATAQRELQEEAGFRAGQIDHLGGLYPVTGYSSEYCEVYVARSLVRDPLAQDKLEDICSVPMPVDEVWRLIAINEIDDALTVATMAFASISHPELAPDPWSDRTESRFQ